MTDFAFTVFIVKAYVYCVAHISIACKGQILMDNCLLSVFMSNSTRPAIPRADFLSSSLDDDNLCWPIIGNLH